MKEVFKKIKEKLETELKCKRNAQTIECIKNNGFGTPLQSKYSGNIEMLLKAIEIVNQVESEYNNGACEWKLEENTGIVWHCSDEKCSTYNDSYIKNLRIVLGDFECICPYCGKRIEVVE